MSSSSVSSSGKRALSSSAIVAEAVQGSHVLRIEGYSRTKSLGNGKFIKSGTFNVGGHSWFIKYYPNGYEEDCTDYISFFLELDHTNVAQVEAEFTFSLIGEPAPTYSVASGNLCTFFCNKNDTWGWPKFIERKALEMSPYLKDDCLILKCDIKLTKMEIHTEDARMQFVAVPPSDLHMHLGHLLSSGEGADVTFDVNGETFSAHTVVLAARSPVFKAQLFGPMKEKNMSHIQIQDIEASVFKALLHFIYKDVLPEVEKDDDMMTMAQHLLVAADRYGLERLKLICEDKLCNYIDTNTTATILALAEQHGCVGLMEACFKFLERNSNLMAVTASDGFEHLATSCPSIIKKLLLAKAFN
ncbi:hypothetical protein ACP70R_007674 [Stipagrostis hirtigluma subsp. patula]